MNDCIINTAIHMVFELNTLKVEVNKANYTHDMIKDTGAQSGREVDKFAGFPEASYKLVENGISVITAGTNAWFSLEVKQTVDLGSRTLLLCEPAAISVLSDAAHAHMSLIREIYSLRQRRLVPLLTARQFGTAGYVATSMRGEELPDDFI